MRLSSLAMAGAFMLLGATAGAAVQVPRVEGVQIDGKSADWGDRGARIDIMLPSGEKLFPADAFNASFRLGWDDRGLLVLLNVKDAVPMEAEKLPVLWQGDSVELFVADSVGGKQRVQFFITPGRDPRFPEIRQYVVDHRSQELTAIKAELKAARTSTSDGYVMELLMPWSVLGRQGDADADDTLGFQLYVNNRDSETLRRQLVFFNRADTGANSKSMHELTLTGHSAAHIQAMVSGEWDRFRSLKASVIGSADLVGRQVKVKLRQIDGPDTEVLVPMHAEAGRSAGTGRLPLPTVAQAQLIASVDGHAAPAVELPSLAAAKGRALMEQRLIFKPAIFYGEDFPQADFENPDLAQNLIGPYQVHASFYNADFQAVTKAEKPGRYGAVVDIQTEDGRSFRRFCTLYRTEKDPHWWGAKVPMQIQWPQEMGLNDAVLKEQASAINPILKQMLLDAAIDRGAGADLFAGLHETAPGTPAATIMTDAQAMDRAWWVKFKRKLYGTDKQFTQPLARPQQSGEGAMMLHVGSDEQAGFKPGTRDKLDALFADWAANSDEGFNVCIARHGVVIVDAAYGQRDGAPMTRRTQSWLASISKALAGSCMMMAVDQGLVSLDDTPDKFLPPLRNVPGRQPAVRQLFTHTAGFWGHWGDEQHDYEQMIAEYLPHLQIGQRYEYNGSGPALGGKILEQLTGQSLPEFYAAHLYGPLQMHDTVSTTASWRTYSTAADLAIFAQMLLNQGSYGDKMFFSKATFQQMLPHRLTKELGSDTDLEWGIGLAWMDEAKTQIGHGAASSSTLRVDLGKGLVITMARNAAGKNFDTYHARMLQMIYANLAEAPATEPAPPAK